MAKGHRMEREREDGRRLLVAYLGLCGRVLILAVGGGAQGGTGSVVTCADASSLCQVLLSLCLPNLNLLLLTAAAELIWLEGVLCLELGPSVLGDVALSHGCGAAALCRDVCVLTFLLVGDRRAGRVAGWLGWVTCVSTRLSAWWETRPKLCCDDKWLEAAECTRTGRGLGLQWVRAY